MASETHFSDDHAADGSGMPSRRLFPGVAAGPRLHMSSRITSLGFKGQKLKGSVLKAYTRDLELEP